MPDFSDLTLLFDGSFEGLLTAFFDAYARRPHPKAILPATAIPCNRGYTVATDPGKAARVIRGIEQSIGEFAYEKIWLAHLADIPDISQAIYRYLLWGFDIRQDIRLRLADDRVIAVDKGVNMVVREAATLRDCVRLTEMEGVYYGEIGPRHHVLPLVMLSLLERYPEERVVVQDCTHRIAGIATAGGWQLVPSSPFSLPLPDVKDEAVRYAWQVFYQKITARQSSCAALQRNLLPKKYWKHLLTLTPDRYTPATSPPKKKGDVA